MEGKINILRRMPSGKEAVWAKNGGKKMGKYRCLCCGYKTLDTRGEFEICHVCFWEDDTYFDFSKEPIVGLYYDREPAISELLDLLSGANHGLSLREAQKNYSLFGACEESMLPHVRKPFERIVSV